MSRLPPGPSAGRFRQLRDYSSKPDSFLFELQRELGSVFTLHVLGQPPWVMVGEPELIRVVFSQTNETLRGWGDPVKYLVGSGSLVTLEGAAHREQRRLLSPCFHHGRMRVYARQMIASVDAVLDRLERGAVLDSLTLMLEVTLRTIVESVFGVTEPGKRERLVELIAVWVRMAQTEAMLASSLVFGGDRVKRALDFAVGRSRARYGQNRPLSRRTIRRYCDAKAEIDDILRGEIARARTEGREGREDILAKLVEVRDSSGRALEDRQLFDHLISLLIGGNDTTALSLTWALHLLARHPSVAERARAELAGCTVPLAEVRVEDLPWLDAVVSEVLRFRPVAQNIPRQTVGELELGPWRLPPDTMVLPSLALAHFREDLWDRPLEFRPERFLAEDKISAWQYFPFGGGSRTCIGRAFGLLELRLVVARMLQRARWESLAEDEPTFAYRGAFLGPDRPIPIRFTELSAT